MILFCVFLFPISLKATLKQDLIKKIKYIGLLKKKIYSAKYPTDLRLSQIILIKATQIALLKATNIVLLYYGKTQDNLLNYIFGFVGSRYPKNK